MIRRKITAIIVFHVSYIIIFSGLLQSENCWRKIKSEGLRQKDSISRQSKWFSPVRILIDRIPSGIRMLFLFKLKYNVKVEYMLFWPVPFRPTLSGPVLKCTKNGPEVYKNAGLKVGVFRPTNIYFLIKKYLFSFKINTLLF